MRYGGRLASIGVALFAVGTLSASMPPPISAADPGFAGGEFRISGRLATGFEAEPAVAYNSHDDEFLVVWSDERHHETHGAEIYGRRIAPDGTRLTGNFRISGRDAREAFAPAVAFNALDNEYLVVWSDARSESRRGRDLYGRRLTAEGARLGRDRRIGGRNAVADEIEPALAFNDSAGEYYVVWADSRNWDDDGRWLDLYARRLGSRGERLGGDRHLGGGAHAAANEGSPAIVYDPGFDHYLVVWSDQYLDGTYVTSIRGRLLTGRGTRSGPTFRISTNPWRDWHPAIALEPTSGDLLVVWENGTAPFSSDVFGRWIRPDGTRRGTPYPISAPRGETSESAPSVSRNADGDGFLVVWASHDRIVGVLTDAAGRPAGTETPVSSRASVEPQWPAASPASGEGRRLVAWIDLRRPETRGTDVYGRVVNP